MKNFLIFKVRDFYLIFNVHFAIGLPAWQVKRPRTHVHILVQLCQLPHISNRKHTIFTCINILIMCIENLVFLKILMKQERTASPQAAQVHGIKNVQEWTIKCLQLFTKTGLTNSSVQDKFEDIALWASIFIEPYFTDCLRCTMHIRP